MLGELARLERRFDEAVVHIGRAAETSGRLGFLQTEAYQTTSLGRAQCQAGDYEAGATTLRSASARRRRPATSGSAALGRVHLGRVLRALGRDAEARAALERAAEFHRDAGGGEQARLGEPCSRRSTATASGSQALLASADAPVEVFALDALGRYEEADAGWRSGVALHHGARSDRSCTGSRTPSARRRRSRCRAPGGR